MKILDALYYAIYRFGRSIGQPHLQAKACAGNFMPAFFVLVLFWFYSLWAFKWYPAAFPSQTFKPVFMGLAVVALTLSYIIYVRKGRGKRIISEYEKSKNQKFYVGLGAIFATVIVSLPMLIWLVWRAIA